MGALPIIAAVGTGMEIYGQISAASAQADAARRNAALKQQQASELLARETINESMIQQQSGIISSRYGSAAAAQGIEGAGIAGQLAILNNTQITIANSRREADFKAQMLRQGADIENKLASDVLSASYIKTGGTLLTSGMGAYDLYKGPSNNEGNLFKSTSGGSSFFQGQYSLPKYGG